MKIIYVPIIWISSGWRAIHDYGNNHVSEKISFSKTNFNVLISTNAEKKEILRILDKLKTLNSNGGVVQYLLDFLHYERKGKSGDLKKCYVYGDLRSILDELDHAGEKIADFIDHMSKIFLEY